MKKHLLKSGLIKFILAICWFNSIGQAGDINVDLLEFEKFHYKLVKVVSSIGDGLFIRYLGATSMNSSDRELNFVKYAGSCTWVLRRDALEGVDPSTEVARIVLVGDPIADAPKVVIGSGTYWLICYADSSLKLDGPIGGLPFSLKNIADRINSFEQDNAPDSPK